jgi:hypothetical protein
MAIQRSNPNSKTCIGVSVLPQPTRTLSHPSFFRWLFQKLWISRLSEAEPQAPNLGAKLVAALQEVTLFTDS